MADKIFHFEDDNKSYETRRYASGFATTDTRYSFETYRTYKYLPWEHKIDVTDFFDDETELQIGESDLKISVINSNDKEQIFFKSTNGKIFSKTLSR